MKLLLIVILILLLVLAVWSVYGYLSVRGIEKPSYTVRMKADGYEIRVYEPYIVAETVVAGNMDAALEEGFRRIAGYIFGGNTTQESIAMTVPVGERASTSENIAMTVPVLSGGDARERVISFVMPKKYTLDTLPIPRDGRVTLRSVPSRTVAALSFSWSTSAKTVTLKKAELAALLARDGVATAGEEEVAFYNPPGTPPFMLHSEILIPISK